MKGNLDAVGALQPKYWYVTNAFLAPNTKNSIVRTAIKKIKSTVHPPQTQYTSWAGYHSESVVEVLFELVLV